MNRPPALILADDFEAQELYEHWVSDIAEPHGCVFAFEAERTAKRYSVRVALVDLTMEDCTPLEYLTLAARHTSLHVPTLLILSADEGNSPGISNERASEGAFPVCLLRRPFSREELREMFLNVLSL